MALTLAFCSFLSIEGTVRLTQCNENTECIVILLMQSSSSKWKYGRKELVQKNQRLGLSWNGHFRSSSNRTDLLGRKSSRGRSLCFGYSGGPAVILMDKKIKVQFKAPCLCGISFRILPSIYFVLLVELKAYRGAHEMEPMSDRSILSI